MDLDEISQLSDTELFDSCKSNGINVGPIGPTTRKVYERKLFKTLKNKISDENSGNKNLNIENDLGIPLQRKSISQYLGLDETPKSYSRPTPNLNYTNVETPVSHYASCDAGDATGDTVDDGNASENSFRLEKLTDNESDNEKDIQCSTKMELSSSVYKSVTKSGVLKRRPIHQTLNDSVFSAGDQSVPATSNDTEYETAALISMKVKLVIIVAVVVFMYLVFESMEPEPMTPELN